MPRSGPCSAARQAPCAARPPARWPSSAPARGWPERTPAAWRRPGSRRCPVNHDDEQLIQQLRDELGSLEVPPAPVVPVTQRGKAIQARRRTLAAGLAVVVAAALLAARFIGAP